MNISCMPGGIVDPLRVGQGVLDIYSAGFGSTVLDTSIYTIELRYNLGNASEAKMTRLSSHPERFETVMTPFINGCRNNGLNISAIYAPYQGEERIDKDFSSEVRLLTEESVKLAVKYDIPYVIVRPLTNYEPGTDVWNENVGYFMGLYNVIKGSGTKILLENLGRFIGGHMIRGVCSESSEAIQWIDDLNCIAGEEVFGFCFNVSTCSLCGQNPYEVISGIGDRIKAVVMSDNDGIHNASYLPFTTHCHGWQTDWLGVIRALREIEFDGELFLELYESAVGFSPVIRPKLLELAKTTADYIAWQIEIEKTIKKYNNRVLFGAGNMCINYMKNYGEKYPPLYTCDNNSSRWGDEIAGLSIHSPQDLKDLSQDVAIFICNVYYREIEAQLRKMKIVNPIEYFNDEFLPVLNMNRMQRVQEG